MNQRLREQDSSATHVFVKRVSLGFLGAIALFFSLNFVPGPIQKEAYMGAEYCGSCHQAEYNQWLNSPHSKTFSQLTEKEKTNPLYLSRNSTGFLDKVNSFLPGVQCEACHGPGLYYSPLHIKKDPVLAKQLFMQRPAADSCKNCHDASLALEEPRKSVSIDHWSPAFKAQNKR